MRQIVYFSTASGFQSRAVIDAILSSSRHNNGRDNISGLLVAGGHRYLQLIEGPSRAIGRLFRHICADERHVSAIKLLDRKVDERIFAEWNMAFAEEPALDRFDSFPQIIDQTARHVSDVALRRRVRCFGELFAAPLPVTSPTLWVKSA